LHFFMNIAIGIYPWLSPGDIAEVITLGYEKKRGINVQRQEDGYDGVSTKCFECKTALDDPGVESMLINQVPHCVPCGTSDQERTTSRDHSGVDSRLVNPGPHCVPCGTSE